MSSIRVLRFADYRVVSETDGCVVREIAAAAAPLGDDDARTVDPWSLRLVDLDPGAEWAPGGSGMLALAFGEGAQLAASSLPRAEVSRIAVGETVVDAGSQDARLVSFTVDPSRALGDLIVVARGERELVGLTWFLVAAFPVRVRLNDDAWSELDPFDTARLDLRERPVSRLGLEPREARPQASAALAFLASVSR